MKRLAMLVGMTFLLASTRVIADEQLVSPRVYEFDLSKIQCFELIGRAHEVEDILRLPHLNSAWLFAYVVRVDAATLSEIGDILGETETDALPGFPIFETGVVGLKVRTNLINQETGRNAIRSSFTRYRPQAGQLYFIGDLSLVTALRRSQEWCDRSESKAEIFNSLHVLIGEAGRAKMRSPGDIAVF